MGEHLANGLFSSTLEVRDGWVEIPNGPRWGVTINQEWLDRAKYQLSYLEQ
jgi:L-alanine-DL-glutamate epimerase-like enolase superfamily enzyme